MTVEQRIAPIEKQNGGVRWALIALCVLAGCSAPGHVRPSKTNRLSIGMAKQDVVSVMGQPMSTAAPGHRVEVLRYRLYDAVWGDYGEYFVKIVDGKVDSYGKVGDFDSTKDPTLNVNIKKK